MIDKLKALAGAPDVTISPVAMYIKPCVYAWVRNNEVLYIGASKKGICRPLNHNIVKLKIDDQLLVWVFKTEKDAFDSETKLIKEIKPKYNIKSNPGEKELRQCLLSTCAKQFEVYKRKCFIHSYCSDNCRKEAFSRKRKDPLKDDKKDPGLDYSKIFE